jgi:putative tricarboxylic transport membrane protein
MMIPAMLLVLLGAITALASLQLPLGTLNRPGSGFFPLLLGLILMGLAACHLWQVRQAAATMPRAGVKDGRGSARRVLLFLGAIGLATALLDSLGFPLITFLLMLAMLEIIGLRRRRDSVVIALGTAVAAYVLFVQWLQIPLPKGWIGL